MPLRNSSDHHRVAGLSEFAGEHLGELGFGRRSVVEDHHAFACGQPVGFQHVGSRERVDEGFGFGELIFVKTLVPGCRYAVACHEGLGEILASFQARAFQRRADHRDVADLAVLAEEVVDAAHKRFFGADHHQVDVVRKHELLDRTEIIGVDIDVGAALCGTCVTRCNEQLGYAGAFGDLAGESVLAAARAQQEDI